MIRLYLYRMPITSDLLLISVGSCGPAVKNDQLLNSGDLLPKHATVRGLLDPSLGEQLQWTAAGIRLQWAKVWAKTCTGFLQIVRIKRMVRQRRSKSEVPSAPKKTDSSAIPAATPLAIHVFFHRLHMPRRLEPDWEVWVTLSKSPPLVLVALCRN